MSRNENYKQYAELRTMLDSLEIGALRYYLNAPDPGKQEANFQYLKTQIRPILDQIWKGPHQVECPEGYHDCGGCCVPYDCMGGGNFPKPRA